MKLISQRHCLWLSDAV